MAHDSFRDASHNDASAAAVVGAVAEDAADTFVGPQASTRLPEANKIAMQRWELALLKHCDAREALGLTAPQDGSGDIDLTLLRRQLASDSPVPMLATPQESVVLGQPVPPGRDASSAWQLGQTTIATTLTQGVCTLRIDDVVVHRVSLAARVPIEARLPKIATAQATTHAYAPKLAGRNYVSVSGLGIWDAVQDATRATPATVARVADRLGMLQPAARRLFVPRASVSWVSAMQVMHGGHLPWFSRAAPDVMGTDEDIASLLHRDDLRTQVRWLMRTSPWPTRDGPMRDEPQQHTPAAAWLMVQATLRITPVPINLSRYHVRVEGVDVASSSSDASDAYVGTRCLQDRAAVLMSGRAEDTITPAWASIAEPCAVFDNGARPHGFTDGVYVDLLPQVLRHATPGPRVDWRGWDAVLLQVAADLQHNQQDIAQTLDPRGQSPAIGRLADAMAMLQPALTHYAHLQNERAAITHMLGVQALRGSTVSPMRLNTILAAMDQAFAAFPDAAQLWVADLEHHDMLQDTTFAAVQHMTAAYVQEAHEAADVAARHHDTYFIDHVYHAILQAPPSMHSLRTYIDTTGRRHILEKE